VEEVDGIVASVTGACDRSRGRSRDRGRGRGRGRSRSRYDENVVDWGTVRLCALWPLTCISDDYTKKKVRLRLHSFSPCRVASPRPIFPCCRGRRRCRGIGRQLSVAYLTPLEVADKAQTRRPNS
jgi:hypothetical protein